MTILTDLDEYPSLTRKSHITRICGTNKNGDQLSDLWVDLERLDIIKSMTQAGEGHYQGHQRKLRWMDDPAGDDFDPNGNPARKLVTVKVCDPSSDNLDDPDEWVPVQMIVRMKSMNSDQGDQHQFLDAVDSGDTTTARVVQVRKVVHYDTNIDDAAQAAFDADSTLTNYVVPANQYDMDTSTKDTDQYVNFEILTYVKHRTNDYTRGQDGTDPLQISGRGHQIKLLNQYLIDWTESQDDSNTGSSGINPPYRLDAFQNIVNVNLGALAVEFLDGAA
jgi:hypothetical protein